jgi:uncharacterized protein (DUF983 family)
MRSASVGGSRRTRTRRYDGDVSVTAPAKRPSFGVLFRRAATLRCAWCGDRPGFRRGWFKRSDSCRHCGMSVQRGLEGFELGAATINAILTFGPLVVVSAISVIITYPDVAVAPLIVSLGATAIILPIVLYPFTYTIWFAVELLMEPPSTAEITAAAGRVRDTPV